MVKYTRINTAKVVRTQPQYGTLPKYQISIWISYKLERPEKLQDFENPIDN